MCNIMKKEISKMTYTNYIFDKECFLSKIEVPEDEFLETITLEIRDNESVVVVKTRKNEFTKEDTIKL